MYVSLTLLVIAAGAIGSVELTSQLESPTDAPCYKICGVLPSSGPMARMTNEVCLKIRISEGTLSRIVPWRYRHLKIHALYLVDQGMECKRPYKIQLTRKSYHFLNTVDTLDLHCVELSFKQDHPQELVSTVPELPATFFSLFPKVDRLWMRQIDLPELNLAGIQRYLPNLRVLKLYNNKFGSINGDFHGFTKLEVLEIENSTQSEINLGMFDGMTKLTQLNIVNSTMTVIRKGDITNLPNLKHLYLINDNIREIEDESLSAAGNLCIIDIGGNQIEYIPKIVLKDHCAYSGIMVRDNRITTLDRKNLEGVHAVSIQPMNTRTPHYDPAIFDGWVVREHNPNTDEYTTMQRGGRNIRFADLTPDTMPKKIFLRRTRDHNAYVVLAI